MATYRIPARRAEADRPVFESKKKEKPTFNIHADVAVGDEAGASSVSDRFAALDLQSTPRDKENEDPGEFELPNTKKNRAIAKAEEERRLEKETKSNPKVDWNQTKMARALRAQMEGFFGGNKTGQTGRTGKTCKTGKTRGTRGGRKGSGDRHKVIGKNGIKDGYEIEAATVQYGVPLKGRKVGDIHWRNDFKPHVPFKGQEDWRVHVIDGREWYNKGRFWITVAVHRSKIAECPIYTYGGKRLLEKPEEYYNPEEYLNLRPMDCKDYQKQSKTMPVLKLFSQTGNPKAIDSPVMVVHFCGVETRDIDRHELQKGGRLTDESAALLVKYVGRGGSMVYGPADEDTV